MKVLPAALVLIVLTLPGVLVAGTIYVDDDAPGDPGPGDPAVSDPIEDGSAAHPYDAIQEGVDAAVTGDTVLVKDGTYTGEGNRRVDFDGKAITVRSENGAASTVVDCKGADRAFRFTSGETDTSVLDGLTITNARNSIAGIYFSYSDPTIRNCVIRGNSTFLYGYGAGVYISSSTPTFTNCTISGNVSVRHGGGIYCRGERARPTFRNCAIIGNSAAEYGGAVYCEDDSAPTFLNCTIAGNSAAVGGGIYVTGSNPTFLKCVLWGDSPQGLYVESGSATLNVCDVQGGWPGNLNIDADPMLTLDGHLRLGSPCIDWAGGGEADDVDGETRPVDIPGVGFDDPPDARTYDIGADEFVDTDADGLPDWWELKHFGSATAAGPTDDDDSDTLTNLEEYYYGTDPIHADVDGDGRNDAQEIADGTNWQHPDNAEKTYYVNGATGNDSYDGLAKVWDGTHGPKATIQAGIDATITGWHYTVEVADGTYTGVGNKNLDFGSKVITVRSEDGPANCIIDCENSGRGFHFHSNEPAGSVVRGFTIQNGRAVGPYPDNCGGGILVWRYEAAPSIIDCVLKNNSATLYGGAFYCRDGESRIISCLVIDNTADVSGGGVFCDSADVTILNCVVAGNSVGSGSAGGVWVSNNTIVGNCTIVGNIGRDGGGVLASETVTIANCIVWGNTVDQISGSATVTYCDVQGGAAGAGNIDLDPELTPEWHLTAGSPCVNQGTSSGAPDDDVDGEARPFPPGGSFDIGADEFVDTDGDGLPDVWENLHYADAAGDPDGDGLLNLGEYEHGTDPDDSDTDGDGYSDGDEVAAGTDPLVPDVPPAHYYVNGTTGHNYWDGLAPVWDGTHGPKKTIKGALDIAISGDTVTIADGLYTGAGNWNMDFAGRAIVLESENGPEATIIDCGGDRRGFYFHTQETPASVVRGFTIRNGYAGGSYPLDAGGGILCTDMSSPTIVNCIFINNISVGSGGGISCRFSDGAIIDCTFIGNTAASGGGAIRCTDSDARVTGCTIIGNTAESGGGITLGTGSQTVAGCVVTDNSATGTSNSIGYGGGIACRYGSATITNCTIQGNAAYNRGGGISTTSDATPTVVNCLIVENEISGNGWGAGVCTSYDSSPTFVNCTIAGNYSRGTGGGLVCDISNSDSTPVLTNCILWGNSPDQIPAGSEGLTVTFCDIQGGWAGTGNIDADPMFDPGGSYRLHPVSPCIDAGNSAAVPPDTADLDGDDDTAEPTPLDLDGNPRFVDAPDTPDTGIGGPPVVDMGAYEFDRLAPEIGLMPAEIEFALVLGDPDPDDQVVSIWNWGSGTLDWEVTEACSWLDAAPATGDSTGEIDEVTLSATVAGLAAGEYNCALTVTSASATNSPQTVTVRLHIRTPLLVPTEYSTIQAALDAASDWDMVLVADGTYSGPGNKDLDFNGKKVRLVSRNGPTTTIIDCENDGRGFYFHSQETALSIIDGFTIRNGSVSGDWPEGSGGGILCEDGSSPTVTDCVFIGNSSAGSGGAIYCYDLSSPTISDCTFNDNSAGGRGGAITCYERCNPTITDCTFSANSSQREGGAIYLERNCSPTITNCVLDHNTAPQEGGGISMHRTCHPTIGNCTVNNNSAERGGGIRVDGSGSTPSNPTITDCTIIGNYSSGWGGGIGCGDGSPVIVNCTISNNRTGTLGGGAGIFCGDETAVINCLISGNSGGDRGGGVYIDGRPTFTNCVITGNSARKGGGICCWDAAAPVIANCTVSGNVASEHGGAVYCRGGTSSEVVNSILWGNLAGVGGDEQVAVLVLGEESHTLTVSYSDVEGGEAAAYVEAGCTLVWGDGNIDADPLLTPDGHIAFGSPCIDWCPTGPADDCEGDSRPVDVPGVGFDDPPDARTFDIGADEVADSDGDGLPDWWEALYYGDPTGDPDGDGLDNLGEYENGADPDNPDTDGDGLTDGDEVHTHGTDPLDTDSDDDGLSDGDEILTYHTDPLDPDTDADGMSDGWEVAGGLDPNDDGSTDPDNGPDGDPDGDGLTNLQEYGYNTDPRNADTDGDGLDDGEEVDIYGTDPLNPDSDYDGLGDGAEVNTYGSDPLDTDTDDDSLTDGNEVHTHGTDPADPDSDDDGLDDGEEITTYGTDPMDNDTDDDGMQDGWEVRGGLDPFDDGTTDPDNAPGADPDGDGRTNIEEHADDSCPTFADRPDKTFFVDEATGLDSYDGLAPAWDGIHGPKATIQAGIDATITGWDYIVLVADGTYMGPGNKELDYGGKAIAVRSEHGASNTTINCQNSGRGFYFHSNETTASVLDGFTIHSGNVTDDGGGILCWPASPTIANCTITYNSAAEAGGGIYCRDGSSPTISNCTISYNSADDAGGGICCRDDCNPTISNCTIMGNDAHGGAGIYCKFSCAVITDCTINYNSSSYYAGGIWCHFESNAIITNCTISDNRASWSAGGISCDWSNPTLTNCTISRNRSTGGINWRGNGGGLDCRDGASPVITGCAITGNSAGDHGGGISCHNGGDPVITDCLISDNEADGDGGGLHACYSNRSPRLTNCVIAGNVADGYGGGIACDDSGEPIVVNCTLVANSAVNGNALGCDSYEHSYPTTVQVTNCVLWDGGSEIWNNDGSTITITYSDVQGGFSGTGNIDADPLFVNPAGGDYHLQPESPCVDAGDPASDYSNEPMPNGGRVNMGAYGNTAEATPTTLVPGDVDGDGDVDIDDLVMVHAGLGGDDPALDLDGDGVVTFADLRIVYEAIPEGEKDLGGVSTLWTLGYTAPTAPGSEGLDPHEDQSQRDNDGDGRTNYEEFVAGTDPTDPASLFAVTAVACAASLDGDTITVTWTAVPGKAYCLYCSETLGEGASWEPAPGGYELGDGTATQTLIVGKETRQLFFKIQVW